MVTAMANLIAAETGEYDRDEWSVPVADRRILFTPDRTVIGRDGSIRIQRLRTGRKTKSEPDNRIYALIRQGAAKRFAGRPVIIETFYPATGEAVPVVAKKDEKLLAEYAAAIAGIERGDFTAKPKNPRQCPNCQCYFICGI